MWVLSSGQWPWKYRLEQEAGDPGTEEGAGREGWSENPEEVVREERKLSKELCLFSKGHTDCCVFNINLFFHPTLSSLLGVFMPLENYLASLWTMPSWAPVSQRSSAWNCQTQALKICPWAATSWTQSATRPSMDWSRRISPRWTFPVTPYVWWVMTPLPGFHISNTSLWSIIT